MPTTPASPEHLRDLAVAVGTAAGEVLAEHARTGWEASTKTSATDPVTDADRASERHIVDALLAARPDDGIVGEEDTGDRAGTSGLRWVIDPLDGTVNYTYRNPQWAVSIAVVDDDGPLAGAVVDPGRGEVFAAARDGGATLDGAPLQVTPVEDLALTLVGTGFGYDPRVRAVQGRQVADLVARVRDVRRGGSAALDLAWVAAGRLDAYWEYGLNPWDWAAGSLLVTEAGGIVHRSTVEVHGQRDQVVAGNAVAVGHLVEWAADRVPA
ncbi:inositol monophosphatase family protein [Salsipaludibacter albus]|uniref:inositol monophosphatase family protein n=1 Tax=Salsipaludibacter albus TaxID=2849650 RepID=UPI001EE3D08F|nr:inositol monophosphatase [Salsipaludibacter albus]